MEELQKAVEALGVREAARIGGVSHSNLTYWLRKGAPKWRAQEVRKIIEAAQTKADAN